MDSGSKKVVCLGANSDIILNLPDNVIDRILVRLSIRDAVRTSVLSTNWRYKWTTITQLVFCDHNLGLPSPPHNNVDKLINFIDRVLLLHTGFIHKFELSTGCLLNCSTVDCWILFLLRKNIKELVLKFSHRGAQRYKLPTCFFSAQQISTLVLEWCVLKPPPATIFTGFSNLKSLILIEITVDNGGFEYLFSKCPVLERLTLNITYCLDHLNLCSPNLKHLCLIGPFQDICFENTPLLSDVIIHTLYVRDEQLNKFLQSETGNVVKVLSSLPNLRKFRVGQFFLKYYLTLSSKIQEKLPFTCHHLTYLSLRLNFQCVNEICVTLCLLNSSPNLQQLEIDSCPFIKLGHDIKHFWKKRTLIDWNMSGLQIVKITNIQGFKLELEFIKLLLTNSPMLEMLIIRSGEPGIQDRKGVKGLKFLKELLIFPRASPKAKVKFFEWNEK